MVLLFEEGLVLVGLDMWQCGDVGGSLHVGCNHSAQQDGGARNSLPFCTAYDIGLQLQEWCHAPQASTQ
jgi:hypothetical protein